MITEQRKQYIRDWKKKNRERVYAAHRFWYKRNRNKPYYAGRSKSHGVITGDYAGTSCIGRKYELIAEKMLPGSNLAESFHGPFDLEWNAGVIFLLGKKIARRITFCVFVLMRQ